MASINNFVSSALDFSGLRSLSSASNQTEQNRDEINKKVERAMSSKKSPSLIICDTIKGKGSKIMENKVLWHYRCPSLEEFNSIKKEIQNYK